VQPGMRTDRDAPERPVGGRPACSLTRFLSRTLRRGLPFGLLLGLLAGGCGGGDQAEVACTRGFDDWAPATGTVTTIALDPAAPLPPAGLASPVPITLGADDPGPFPFFRIGALLRLDNGTLAVLDQGTQELHLFDGSGGLTATVGGRGDGPGEFRSAGRLLVLGPDSVGVIDGSLGRLTVFGPDGAMARVTPLPTGDRPDAPLQQRLTLLEARADGGWIGRLPLEVTPGDAPMYRDSVAVVVVGPDGGVERTLGRHPDGDRWNLGARSAQVGGVRLMGAERLAGSRPTLVAPLPGGVAIARGDRFGIVVLDEDGGVVTRIALEAPCRPFTEEVAERSAASGAAALRMEEPAAGAGAFQPIDADLAAEARAFYLEAPRVPHLAPMDQMLGGADGSLWIRAFVPSWDEGDDLLWVGIGPDGQEIDRITAPRNFRALRASNAGLEGVIPDALGEESLVKLLITERAVPSSTP